MKKGLLIISVLTLLSGCSFRDIGEFVEEELQQQSELIKVEPDTSLLRSVDYPQEVLDLFDGLENYIPEAEFQLILANYKENEYRSESSDQLYSVPQYTIKFKDTNTNLNITIVINSNYQVRSNYTHFDETVSDLDLAFEIYMKTNEFLFENVADHEEYQSIKKEYKQFIDKNRGLFLDGDSLHEKFGKWEYFFSSTLDDATFLNREVIDEEINYFDKTK